MLKASIWFFIIALIAAVFGANDIMGLSMDVGKTLLYIFLALSAVSFIFGLASTGRPPRKIP